MTERQEAAVNNVQTMHMFHFHCFNHVNCYYISYHSCNTSSSRLCSLLPTIYPSEAGVVSHRLLTRILREKKKYAEIRPSVHHAYMATVWAQG